MTDMENLLEAVRLIRNHCMIHKCIDCPLLGVTCGIGLLYPSAWRLDILAIKGCENDVNICDNM